MYVFTTVTEDEKDTKLGKGLWKAENVLERQLLVDFFNNEEFTIIFLQKAHVD
jgi:hypothetical protein